MRYSFLLLPVLFLAACEHPSPVPRGYKSYAEPYKSAPGPKPASLGYEYSEETNAEIESVWRASVQDLAGRLEARLPSEGVEIYLAPAPESRARGAMLATYDHMLRGELAARGYALTTAPKPQTIVFVYDIAAPEEDYLSNEAAEGYEKLLYRDYTLRLGTRLADALALQIEETYYLPATGYKAGMFDNFGDIKNSQEKGEYNR